MERYCTFHVKGMTIGLDVGTVREVVRLSSITPVPLTAPEIRGLINLRGDIVTAIDLGVRFGFAPVEIEEDQLTHVIIADNLGLLSLVVDRAGDVVEVDRDRYEAPPDTLRGEARKLIRGAFKLPDRLLLDLDLAHVIDVRSGKGGDS